MKNLFMGDDCNGNENSAHFLLSFPNHAEVTSWGASGEQHWNREKKSKGMLRNNVRRINI